MSRQSIVTASVCMSVCLSVCLSVSLCVCVCVCMWWCRVSCGVVSRTSRQGTVTASVRLPVCVPVCLCVCLFVRLCMVVLSFLRNRFSHIKTGYCNCLHLCKRRCQTALHSLHSPFYSSRLLLKTKACKERSATAPSLFVRFKLANG